MPSHVWQYVDLATSVANPNEQSAKIIIERLLPRVTYTDLAKAIIAHDKYLNDKTLPEEKKQMLFYQFDPISAMFNEFDINKYKTIHSLLKKKGKRSGKSWWDYISDYLKRPEKLMRVLSQEDPNIKNLMETKEGLEYVRYLCMRDYDFFYHWTWFFPRRHVGCHGMIKYGSVKTHSMNIWAFYCAKCGMVIPEATMDTDYVKEEYTYKIIKKKKAPRK